MSDVQPEWAATIEVPVTERTSRGLLALGILHGDTQPNDEAAKLLADAVELAMRNEASQWGQGPGDGTSEQASPWVSLACPNCTTINDFPAGTSLDEDLVCSRCSKQFAGVAWLPVAPGQ